MSKLQRLVFTKLRCRSFPVVLPFQPAEEYFTAKSSAYRLYAYDALENIPEFFWNEVKRHEAVLQFHGGKRVRRKCLPDNGLEFVVVMLKKPAGIFQAWPIYELNRHAFDHERHGRTSNRKVDGGWRLTGYIKEPKYLG